MAVSPWESPSRMEFPILRDPGAPWGRLAELLDGAGWRRGWAEGGEIFRDYPGIISSFSWRGRGKLREKLDGIFLSIFPFVVPDLSPEFLGLLQAWP